MVLENAELTGGYWSLRFVVFALKDEQRDFWLVPSATAAFDKGWSAARPPSPAAATEPPATPTQYLFSAAADSTE